MSDIKPKIEKNMKKKINLNSSSDSDLSDDDSPGFGIYSKKIIQTKKEINEVHQHALIETDKCHETLQTVMMQKNLDHEDAGDNSSSLNTSNDLIDQKNDDNSDYEPLNTKYKKKDREDSPTPPSPPPPPSFTSQTNSKRKLTNKKLEELEIVNTFSILKRVDDTSFIDNETSFIDDNDKLITVRVATNKGVKRWEINRNETFKKIFEQVAEIENINVENLVLMLQERIISFSDTPESVNLQLCDIIECHKISKPVQERVKMINEENEETETNNPNLISITLQGEEGRKSRIKFQIAKDETFDEILKKYCEKKQFDYNNYIMEFDGEKVDLTQTPIDLDLEGEEIFDVRCSKKPLIQHINENKKNYEFDDDIVIV